MHCYLYLEKKPNPYKKKTPTKKQPPLPQQTNKQNKRTSIYRLNGPHGKGSLTNQLYIQF